MATNQTTRSICPRCQRPIKWTGQTWRHIDTGVTCTHQPNAPIHDYMVTSSDGEISTYGNKADAQELWEACIHRCIHEPTHAATLTEGDTITGFYARVDGIVLYDSRLA